MAAHVQGAVRAKSYDEALEKAGDSGVIVYCYGPDWNKPSLKLLDSFWNTPAAEAAAGNAVMLAVPFYERDTAKGADEASSIRGRMPAPPFNVCPTIMLFDKTGRRVASFQGADYFGTDEACTEAQNNMRKYIEALRKQQELLGKAAGLIGQEKAKILLEVAELPVERPADFMEQLKLADPADKLGGMRRLTFRPREDLVYKLMDTTDGFLKPDFEADFDEIKKECEKMFKDETLRPEDRQAAFSIYIGQARREGIPPNQLKGLIKKVHKLAPDTTYGKISPALADAWGALRNKLNSDERKAAREAKRAKDKEKKAAKRDKRRAEETIEID
mgnify:CR=1 FL=1